MSTLIAAIDPGAIVALGAIILVAIVALGLVIMNVLYLCPPNEVLIFSGRSHPDAEGGRKGYRVITGGRGLKIPLLETVDRLDLTNMIIEVQVRNAYSKGGIPLTVQGIANIKIPRTEPLLSNTLERFLGKSRAEIMKVARETLEGNLRGVLSTLTPEEVNQDKERFARQLGEEAESDLAELGLEMDTLKVQNVTDEVGYLDSIGRMRSAQIRRDAQIAEATTQAEAAEKRWKNTEEGEKSKIVAQMEIVKSEVERRIADAQTRRAADIAKQQAEVQALVAQAQARIAMEVARTEQVRLQLEADIIQPAEAKRQESEQKAKGDAASIVEQGKATAKVLTDLGTAFGADPVAARDVLLMQKLVPLLENIGSTMANLQIDKVTVLGSGGDGSNLAGNLVSANEQIKAATGVDVPALLGGKTSTARRTPPPAPQS